MLISNSPLPRKSAKAAAEEKDSSVKTGQPGNSLPLLLKAYNPP